VDGEAMTNAADRPLAGHRVLLVEDETTLALLVEDMLQELGAEVAGLAASPVAAIELLGRTAPTLALLDVNLAGQRVYPVVEHLERRSIPFIFLTGYGREGIDAEWKRYPMLQKPFDIGALEAAMEKFPSSSSP
jgi:CheY-like chemotaxis protein